MQIVRASGSFGPADWSNIVTSPHKTCGLSPATEYKARVYTRNKQSITDTNHSKTDVKWWTDPSCDSMNLRVTRRTTSEIDVSWNNQGEWAEYQI